MVSRTNLYMFSLLLTLLGVIGFIINSKEFIHIPGLLLLSILFMIIPGTLIALNLDTEHLTKIQSFFLVIIPLIFLNYIYYIIMKFPVGFSDVSSHILQCQQSVNLNGVIQFSERLSFNFVALYIIFNFLMATSNLSLITLASLIPPIFNLILTVTVYLIVNKLHSHKVALIAMLFYGWENQVILFGHEIRTQTLGILLLFIALFIEYSKFKKSTSTIILMIILSSSAMSSFVSIFFTSIIFCVMFVISALLYFASKWEQNAKRITYGIFQLYFIICIFYLLYISKGFDNLIRCIINLYNQMLVNTDASEFSKNQLVHSTGQTLYGQLVQNLTYLFWGLFLVFMVLYVVKMVKEKKSNNLKFFASFSALLFYTFFNVFAGSLSSGRIYIVGFIIMATTLAYGLVGLQVISKTTQFQYISKIFAITIISFFVVSSIVKLPNYIIGEPNPIRSKEPIDSIFYWYSDLPQYYVSEFISAYAPNKSLNIYTDFQNYFLMQRTMKNTVGQEKLSILNEKFYKYQNISLNQLPKYQMFEKFDKIYSNTDYIIFRGLLSGSPK